MMFDMFASKSHLNNNNKARGSSELISLISDLSSTDRRPSTERSEAEEETTKTPDNESAE